MNILKKYHTVVQGLFLITICAMGCNDDFVSTRPLNEVPEEETWQDAGLAEAFVTEIYNGFGQGGFDEEMLASLSDEAMFTHPGRGINTITEARSNDADQGWNSQISGGTHNWGNLYRRIRAANIAIQNLANPQFDNSSAIASQLMGQAYFLRAFFYTELLRYYGAVPLVDSVYGLGEQDYTIARNTFEENVEFIVADCDQAAELLADAPIVDGRASAAAALALKARVLTKAASDLHDIPTASTHSETIANYSNPEYVGYTSGSRTERWQRAQTAAKAVMDAFGPGYMLDLTEPVTPEEATANYLSIAMAGGSNTVPADGKADLILGRFFIDLKDEGGNYVGRNNGPNGYHNWAGNTPTQQLVDDYGMVDGSPFDWSDPAHAAAPYTNRDPRFYAAILYDGADWKPRTADVAGRDPANQIQTGQYEVRQGGNTVIHYGLDTRNSSVEDWNGSYTGYYIRKFIDPDPTVVDQNTRQFIPWPVLRYTEVVLNYIEASIELGNEAEARTWLNRIRFRAGLPAITASGDALRDAYRNERRIELAYEEHRFHDARRWMIAAEALGRKVGIMRVFGRLKAGSNVSTYRYDPDSYDYTYTVGTIDPGIENRQWLDKMYFIAIHRDEMNRNGQLVQNPGY
ncbi:RagB/SusD family nutrient uptake outer membrane protein [Parapedobacter koreensis]|uniref:Starch-binding associating with outer membrane n=1 Tax=Parapedobacter koreensis TaxID=332977 RepID=A0A1H7STI2_9SPHI|nr:RagB/SusD family nutrient uptake outer membrane protein [Parapedobacter koreensis]SEL75930.1 Starch-binding associating with outer membrane [Parapedobacter koreensis]